MPGRLPAGLRVRPIVRAVDVMPTLLDLTGLALPPRLDGASLVPLLLGRTTEGPGPAPIDNDAPRSGYGLSPLAGLRSGPYLYVRAPRPELYDAEQDALEKEDMARRLPAVVARLEAELVRYVPDPPERSRLADPKDRLDLVDLYQSALALEARGDPGGAEAGLVALLSEAPGFVFAWQRLSEVLLRRGRTAEALATLKAQVDRGVAGETTYLNLALACHRLGDPAATLEWLQKGVDVDPRSPGLRHRLGRVLLERERFAEAEAELRKATQMEPRFIDAHLALGEALVGLRRGEEARREYQEALELSPSSTEAREGLARLQVSRR
jgi:tetratricopeptide (TPR) repeat protein